MPTAGQVYDLQVPSLIGPWKSKETRHPGLVVSRMAPGRDLPWIVVPMTGSRPYAERITHVPYERKVGSLDPPMWILCEYPTTVPQDMLSDLTPRGVLPREVMALVRNKLAWVFGIGFGPPQP
jgi:hypothetical protein